MGGRILDPIERVSEMIFGLLMAMTFIGAINAASDGRQEVRTMMLAALGCNLAWGLTDAVMYLVATLTERTRGRTLLARLRREDAAAGRSLIAEVLPPTLVAAAGTEGLERLRGRLAEMRDEALPPRLGGDDFKGALGVFLAVVIATFPVVVPFMLVDSLALAMRLSNGAAIGMLFIGGWALARYSGGNPWRAGAALAAIGAVLTGAIMALGG
jgi:VIT1/CCC1 family predicted Fe2+/Mn2+ transporter